jgi:hypothetical protein
MRRMTRPHNSLLDVKKPLLRRRGEAKTRQPPYESNASNPPAAECVPSADADNPAIHDDGGLGAVSRKDASASLRK